jgi:hypothetical protein
MYGNAIPASKQIVIPMKVSRIILVVPFDWRSSRHVSGRSSFLDWTNQASRILGQSWAINFRKSP